MRKRWYRPSQPLSLQASGRWQDEGWETPGGCRPTCDRLSHRPTHRLSQRVCVESPVDIPRLAKSHTILDSHVIISPLPREHAKDNKWAHCNFMFWSIDWFLTLSSVTLYLYVTYRHWNSRSFRLLSYPSMCLEILLRTMESLCTLHFILVLKPP